MDIIEQSTIDGIYDEQDLSESGYVVSPKEYIMVQLAEKINLPDDVTAHIRAKTRYTRLGILVSDQHCNSTYEGVLSLGLFNATDYPIRIRKRFPIAQIVFEQLASVPSEDKKYKNKKNSHYHKEKEFVGAKFDDELIENTMREILQ